MRSLEYFFDNHPQNHYILNNHHFFWSFQIFLKQSLQLFVEIYTHETYFFTSNFFTSSQVETEAALTSSPEKRPATNWPQAGKIVFKDVNLRYSPSESPVLRNLNFVIRPREKVGIVGRTGAGKSSLVSALFRLAPIEGLVELDNVATEEIGLHDLRSKISIIPQEPFLFTGTLRQNLDPFDSYSDNELWRALEEVELKHLGLDGPVLEGGGNLSVGQRRKCLCRHFLRQS